MAAISAVATIVAAAIAGVLAINSGSVHVSLTDPADEVDEVRATATSLDEDNVRLAGEVAELEEQLAAAIAAPIDEASVVGATTDVTSGPTTRQSTVRRQTGATPLTFTWGYGVDLDTMDTDWQVGTGSDFAFDASLSSGGRLNAYDVVMFDHVPTEAECRDATVRQTSLRTDQSVAGAMLCLVTSEDRYAFVRIASIDEEQRTTSLDVVVWE